MSIDLQQFAVAHQGSAAVTVPRELISFVAVDSQTRAVLVDRTGANAVQFPAVLATFSAAERDQFADGVAMLVIQILRQRLGA